MRSVFYRYIRPVQFDTKRTELVTNPYGGVCLHFEILGDTLWFTHSRCAMNELFSKDVAKRVTDQRAKVAKESGHHKLGMYGSLPITKKTEDLLKHVAGWSEIWVPDTKEAAILYHAFELKELASYLRLIEFNNGQQEQLAQDWKASLAAANYGEMYGKL